MQQTSKAPPARRPPMAEAKAAARPAPPAEDDPQSSSSYETSEEEDAADEQRANEAAQPALPPPQAEGQKLPPPPPPPSTVHLVPAAAGGADDAAGAFGGKAVIGEWARTGEWRTFTQDALFKGWLQVIADWGVDIAAQQSLFCLAQHSQLGYQEANDVIGKAIIRKQQSGPGSINNISGWLTSACNDARKALHYQDWYHSLRWQGWRNDYDYRQYCQQYGASSNIGDHRSFQGYVPATGHHGDHRADHEQRRGDGDVGRVSGVDHRVDDSTPDRRLRDPHADEESDCADHRDRR